MAAKNNDSFLIISLPFTDPAHPSLNFAMIDFFEILTPSGYTCELAETLKSNLY